MKNSGTDSMEKCRCYLRNVLDLLARWENLRYERRFGEPFQRPSDSVLVQWLNVIRFQSEDQSRLHQFGKKVFPGFFLGYALIAGRIWKGDIPVADMGKDGRIGNPFSKNECKRKY